MVAARARAEAEDAAAAAARARAEADRLAGSTSYIVGRILVGSIRHPTRILQLPGEAAELWKRRGRAKADIPIVPKRDVRADIGGRRADDRLLLVDSGVAIGPRTKPVVLGVVTDATADALADVAIVDRVTPNDALLAVERVEPDLVLVETAALGPARPWAYAAGPAAIERAAVLVELLDRARHLGRPSVLVRGGRATDHVGLIPLEPSFDLVVAESPFATANGTWSRGVRLSRFHPHPSTPRDVAFVHATDGVPSGHARARGLLAATLVAARDAGLEIALDAEGPGEPGRLPDAVRELVVGRRDRAALAVAYRRAVAIVADPFAVGPGAVSVGARALEQLASGARLISGPNPPLSALADRSGAAVTFVDAADQAGEAMACAREAGPPAALAVRRLLRTLFFEWAAPVMLARLAREVGVGTDALAARTSTALVRLRPDGDVDAVVRSLTGQLVPPTRVIVATDGADWPDTADAAVRHGGIDVDVLRGEGGLGDPWQRVAASTTTWVLSWPVDRPIAPTWLLDLLVGGETSPGELVGYGDGDPYRYVSAMDPGTAIVRREAWLELGAPPLDVPAGAAGARFDPIADGWRALSVGPEETEGVRA